MTGTPRIAANRRDVVVLPVQEPPITATLFMATETRPARRPRRSRRPRSPPACARPRRASTAGRPPLPGGSRSRRRILVHAEPRREHPQLPAPTGAREAADAVVGDLRDPSEIRAQRRHLLLRAERHERMLGPEVVLLDRQLRLDAERLEQLVRAREQLERRHGLPHPTEDDPRAVALETHGNDSRPRLEADLVELERPGEDERRAEDRVAGERELRGGREDPELDVTVPLRRIDEGRLGEVDLARERLELLLGDLAGVGEDRELVPGERDVGEDVGDDVAKRWHPATVTPNPVYASPRMQAIEVSGLRKAYGNLEAVRGVDFAIEEGEVFGLLGPNGAGKTTTVEILEGYRKRDAGDVRVLGSDPEHPAPDFRERIGVVLQQSDLWPNLTVHETHAIFAGYYRAPRDVDEVIALVGLEEKAGARVKTLSGGQKRRLDLGIALVGDPDLVFLDEPTTGFDPQARRAAWEMIRSLRSLGKTVLLTTHYLDEAEQLSDRVAVMREGLIVRVGTPRELTTTELQTEIRYRRDGEDVLLRTDAPTRVLAELTAEAVARGEELEGLQVRRPSLEEVYLALTADEGLE